MQHDRQPIAGWQAGDRRAQGDPVVTRGHLHGHAQGGGLRRALPPTVAQLRARLARDDMRQNQAANASGRRRPVIARTTRAQASYAASSAKRSSRSTDQARRYPSAQTPAKSASRAMASPDRARATSAGSTTIRDARLPPLEHRRSRFLKRGAKAGIRWVGPVAPQHRVVFLNARAEPFWGLRLADVAGRPAREVLDIRPQGDRPRDEWLTGVVRPAPDGGAAASARTVRGDRSGTPHFNDRDVGCARRTPVRPDPLERARAARGRPPGPQGPQDGAARPPRG